MGAMMRFNGVLLRDRATGLLARGVNCCCDNRPRTCFECHFAPDHPLHDGHWTINGRSYTQASASNPAVNQECRWEARFFLDPPFGDYGDGGINFQDIAFEFLSYVGSTRIHSWQANCYDGLILINGSPGQCRGLIPMNAPGVVGSIISG